MSHIIRVTPIIREIIVRMPQIFNTYEVIADFDSNFKHDYQFLVNNSANEQGAHSVIGKALAQQIDLIESIGNVSALGLDGNPGNPRRWKKL